MPSKSNEAQTKVSVLVEWFEDLTPVREGPDLIPGSLNKITLFHIFDGCHDYSTHDMSDL